MKNNKEQESYLLEFFKIIAPYKWSIITIALISTLLSILYLHFKPYIYESSAIIKIKTENNMGGGNQDPLMSALSLAGNAEVSQELAILNTFYTNNKAIDKLGMKVQYFTKKNYKKQEIFSNPPIIIKDIEIHNHQIIGKMLIIHPKEGGFTIQKDDTISNQLFAYNKKIESQDFSFTVDKQSNFENSIYIKLNGNNRNIYESIVKRRLKVSRLNAEVSLIKISYQDTSINRANNYINALIDIYIEQSINDKSKKNNKILDFISQQLVITGEKLNLSETQLQKYRTNNNVIQPTAQSGLLLERLNSLEIEIAENKIRKKLIENLIIFIKSNQDLESIVPTLTELGETPTITLIQTIQDLKRKASELEIKFTEKHPDLISIRKQINRNQRTVFLNVKNLSRSINNRVQNLIKRRTKDETNLKNLPEKEKQLIQYQRNYDVNAKMYSYLLEKKSENSMKKVALISDFEIIDRAYSNPRPIKPKKAMMVVLAFTFGLLFGIIIAYIRNLLIKKVQDIKDVKKLTSLPIYAQLPLSSKSALAFDVSDSAQSLLKTSLRNLRTTLQFMSSKTKGNTILITSSVANEGKATIVSTLSTVFQKAGYKSIIVDMDLYQPTLHEFFNINKDIGMSTYLNKKDSIGDIISSTSYQNLDIIPAGPIAPNASELILSKRFNSLLSTLQNRYDYIFINAAPLSLIADTHYLMQFTDTNMISIRKGYTDKSFLFNLDKTLKERKIQNTGLLFLEQN
ncbi:MAG: polysaccharide biosynthesis tyrosine autokinase [Sulfurovaceae bacterium]|nr:polysaccharide biosynthesis tyrosine autokinase [Sulfurovaceae bacterium]